MKEEHGSDDSHYEAMSRRQFLRRAGMLATAAAMMQGCRLASSEGGNAVQTGSLGNKEREVKFRFWQYKDLPDGTQPTAADAAEILPGLWYVGGYTNCCYLLHTAAGPVMVDTGVAAQTEQYLTNIRRAGCDPAKLIAILHTHGHSDHTGATPDLVSLSGAKTMIGKEDAQQLAARVAVTRALSDGDKVVFAGTELTFIHTPGHTPGCGMYLGEFGGGRVCFIGDAVGPYVFERKRTEEEADAFRASAQRMKQVSADLYLPGHPHQILEVSPEGDPRFTQKQWCRYIDGRVVKMEEFFSQHSR